MPSLYHQKMSKALFTTISTEKYAEWLSEHENDYYFEVVRVGDTYYAIANEYYTAPAWAVEIEPLEN